MALRSTTTRLLNARLLAQRQPIITAAIRPQSTLTTGETLEDPQIGDYPNLPRMTAQVRGPYGWWDPQDKRNFGEDVHEEDEMFGVWAPDLHHYSPKKAIAQVLAFVAGIVGLSAVVHKTLPERPVVQRTYPYNGLTEEFGARDDDVRKCRGARAGEE